MNVVKLVGPRETRFIGLALVILMIGAIATMLFVKPQQSTVAETERQRMEQITVELRTAPPYSIIEYKMDERLPQKLRDQGYTQFGLLCGIDKVSDRIGVAVFGFNGDSVCGDSEDVATHARRVVRVVPTTSTTYTGLAVGLLQKSVNRERWLAQK